MQLISCQNGQLLRSLKSEEFLASPEKQFGTGLDAIDALAPRGGFARGAIHELLFAPNDPAPRMFSLVVARAAAHRSHGRESVDATPRTRVRGYEKSNDCDQTVAIVWCDPQSQLYPPAISASGISLDRLYLLRPRSRDDLIWSIAECLRCKGVAATIATIGEMSRIEARRLQLAAEQGAGVGLLMRSMIKSRSGLIAPPIYAAATRWRIAPATGER